MYCTAHTKLCMYPLLYGTLPSSRHEPGAHGEDSPQIIAEMVKLVMHKTFLRTQSAQLANNIHFGLKRNLV